MKHYLLVLIMAFTHLNLHSTTEWSVDFGKYNLSMTVIAQVMDGDTPLANIKLGAFVGEECRAVEQLQPGQHLAFLTIQGARNGEIISFRMEDANGQTHYLPATVLFWSNDIIGTPEVPCLLQLQSIFPVDLKEGGAFASAGSLAGREKIQLSGEWDTESLALLKQAIHTDGTAPNTNLRECDFRGATLAAGCDPGNLLAQCKELTSLFLNEIPANAIHMVLLEGSNPNCLVHLPAGSLVPGGWKNTVCGLRAGEVVLKDGHPFHAAYNFVAEKISYMRSFSLPTLKNSSAGWESIVLPFDVSSFFALDYGNLTPFGNPMSSTHLWTTANPSGYKPFWLRRLNEGGFTEEGELKANIPYIISMPNSPAYQKEYNICGEVIFSGKGTVYATPYLWEATQGSAFDMYPTFREVISATDIFRLNKEDVGETLPAGSAFIRNSGEVNPFEVYVKAAASVPSSVKYFSIGGGSGGSTALMEMAADKGNRIKVYESRGKIAIESDTAQQIPLCHISGTQTQVLTLQEGLNLIEVEKGVWLVGQQKVIIK